MSALGDTIRRGGYQTVLIDGRSGAGKTTLSERLAAELGWPVVHVEDFYPGWGGLWEARGMVATDVFGRGGYRRWDWLRDQQGEWVEVPAGPLIVEGVGAISEASIRVAPKPFTVLLEAPASLRKARALARDPYYAPWWEMWAAQEIRHFRELPPVDVVLSPPE